MLDVDGSGIDVSQTSDFVTLLTINNSKDLYSAAEIASKFNKSYETYPGKHDLIYQIQFALNNQDKYLDFLESINYEITIHKSEVENETVLNLLNSIIIFYTVESFGELLINDVLIRAFEEPNLDLAQSEADKNDIEELFRRNKQNLIKNLLIHNLSIKKLTMVDFADFLGGYNNLSEIFQQG